LASARTFDDLVAIMDRLREPGGCPWDREQTFATIRGYLIEECYEAVDALDGGDRQALCEELGDLLFQIVFLSRMAKEEGAFAAGDVVERIAAKMIRRHPHVFGADTAADSTEVLRKWEEIKRAERRDAGIVASKASILDGIPHALPSLVKAQRLGAKAARIGFDWPSAEAVLDKLREETAEVERAIATSDRAAIREEIGDLLFTLAMLARRADVDADEALAAANAKFRARFARMEDALAARGVPVEDAGLALLETLWGEAKRAD